MAGNENSGRKQEKPFRDALRIELAAAENNQRGLRLIAKKLIEAAEEGKMDAIREIGDRIDGKVPQAVVGDADADPIGVIFRTVYEALPPKDK
jgi:molecular chaperone GrpE (heat shock protein)